MKIYIQHVAYHFMESKNDFVLVNFEKFSNSLFINFKNKQTK